MAVRSRLRTSLRNNEHRFVSTAEIDGKLHTVVWTWRGAQSDGLFHLGEQAMPKKEHIVKIFG